jgi:hypothetical protein
MPTQRLCLFFTLNYATGFKILLNALGPPGNLAGILKNVSRKVKYNLVAHLGLSETRLCSGQNPHQSALHGAILLGIHATTPSGHIEIAHLNFFTGFFHANSLSAGA